MRIVCWSFVLMGVCGTTHAAVVSYTQSIASADLPVSLAEGAWESNSNLYLFAEGQGVELAAPVAVDIAVSGQYDDFRTHILASAAGTIGAGTIVDSFLLHFDPVGHPRNNESAALQASITFAGEILGLMVRNPTLVAADAALGGLAGYPDLGKRGPDRGEDVIALSADRRTLTLNLSEWNDLDQIRVVALAVPEPASWVLAALGFVAVVQCRRRRRIAPSRKAEC